MVAVDSFLERGIVCLPRTGGKLEIAVCPSVISEHCHDSDIVCRETLKK